ALRGSGDDALHPADYQPELLADMANTATTLQELADVEINLSKVFVDYATHLAAGRVEPNKFNREINLFPGAPDPVDILTGIADTEEFTDYILALAPNTPNYDRLKRALALYREKAENGGWPVIPEGEVLKPGMEDPRVPVLLERMIAQDLYEGAGNGEGLLYDGDIVDAVKLFQERHGLEVDGVIGKNTLAQINVPIEERIHQMELNMERRRWMKDDLGYKYVFANLADQAVKVVKGTKTIHWARIVVGKPYHRTPVFSENMTYAVVNPYWNVPRSIAVNEYLPKLRKNPGAVRAQNIRVLSGKNEFDPYSIPWNTYSKANFPFRLRQDPGKGNALGRIKFMFPNKFNVYIHDTPSKSLFARASRAFSHGCMRVQDPLALGAVL
ncbi:MAG: L,D-transpeptidase family protein, partial [Phycisphaerales bacterium]|nr:L,D-transpeptidase family protein [Phycisphaerales bacterium]